MATAQNGAIQISAVVFAKYFRTRRDACLKPTKYASRRENQIPFKYYRSAIATIIRFHKLGSETVFQEAIANLQHKIDIAEKHSQTIVPRNNLRAIEGYRRHFRRRDFKPQPISPIHFEHAEVIVSAKPEMIVMEQGQRKLIRFDMKRTVPNEQEIDALLDLTYLAARKAGVEVQPENIILLRIEDGQCWRGRRVSPQRKSQLEDACSHIRRQWEHI